ncbi:MAG: polysulfide reductase NrfD [Nitrospirae bacterium]|nr:polysulfide reductase NrfD [Nitrospirota bacterium]MBF0592004.1 polysulfide reductase NrfD [Nitrospirota bacterium]
MLRFIKDLISHILKGTTIYYVWLVILFALILNGLIAYSQQLQHGLIVTNMRDQVSWGFYISNFTFLVGVAAAAVLLVIPAYLYNFKPIKEIVLFGEMIAVTALIMCILFIVVDMGRPQYAWHIFLAPNFPSSLLVWDVIALNGYLVINLTAVIYVLYRAAHGKAYSMSIMWPIVLLSIPWAISIHTVTAFLYNGLSSRPFWNASIVAPRFIASALCSGPALMILIFQVARKLSKIDVTDTAIFKIAELIAYAMAVNLYLFGAEIFKEFYSGSVHLAPMKYLFFGLHGHNVLVPFSWTALACNLTAFALFINPKTRKKFFLLNIACVLIIIGVYIEKGMGLIIPGFVPDTLGEIYDYLPSALEINLSAGIWAIGALFYTFMIKTAIPIYEGELTLLPKGTTPEPRSHH